MLTTWRIRGAVSKAQWTYNSKFRERRPNGTNFALMISFGQAKGNPGTRFNKNSSIGAGRKGENEDASKGNTYPRK